LRRTDRTFAELLIDYEEDRTLRAVLVGMLREGEGRIRRPHGEPAAHGDARYPARHRGGVLMTRGFRIAHLVVVSVVLAGIVAQPFLIGLFLFGAVHNADLHAIVGYTLFEFGAPLLLIAALLARLPRREMLLTLLLIVDIFVQIVLVNLRESAPVLAALHPLNAFALLLVAVMLVRADRALLRGGDAEPVPSPASEM
jgi:hypothetical protein